MNNQEFDNAITRARQITNEGRSRKQFPVIKFLSRESKNGKAGTFTLLRKKEGSNDLIATELTQPVQMVILRIRRGADNNKGKFIYEFDDLREEVTLKNGDATETGTYKDLKERHPDLKFKQICYCALPKQDPNEAESKFEIVRLTITGASLKPFFSFLNSIAPDDTVMRHWTLLKTSEPIPHDQGEYRVIDFTLGEENQQFIPMLTATEGLSFSKAPIALAEGHADEVDQGVPDGEEPQTPDTEEEINVEDIPF